MGTTCEDGVFPSDDQQKEGIRYGFPFEGNDQWLKTHFNCATMPSYMRGALGSSLCQVPQLYECQRTGQMRDCPTSGNATIENWCDSCYAQFCKQFSQIVKR